MGWEFAASWVDDPDQSWQWRWRRIADDSGAVIAESPQFARLDTASKTRRKTASTRATAA
jgi:hypothetical protein